MASAPAPPKGQEQPPALPDDRQRFLLDLEFLQLLASPQYLSFLSQRGYFEDESFLRYLRYLDYFRRPEYVTFVSYPDALEMLDLLNGTSLNSSPAAAVAFRKALARAEVAEMVRGQQLWRWRGGGGSGGGAVGAPAATEVEGEGVGGGGATAG